MRSAVFVGLIVAVLVPQAGSAQAPHSRPGSGGSPSVATPTTPTVPPVPRPMQPRDSVREDRPAPHVTARDQRTDAGNGSNRGFLAPPSIAAVWQPHTGHLEVFALDARGALRGVWKSADGYWQPSFTLSGPGLSRPGGGVAATWQPLNEQLEVFTVDTSGSLRVAWTVRNGPWSRPTAITPPGFAPPGANLAAVFQPLNNQLEVFAVDAAGAVRLTWKAQNGQWQEPAALTPPGVAPAGAPIAAVWQPLNEQLEVFWIDTVGALRGVWKQHNRSWEPVVTLTARGFAEPGAHLAAVWQPLGEQLEVFTTDGAGAVKGVWKAHNGAWQPPFVLDGPGVAVSGAQIAALFDPVEERLQVITVARSGELIHAYKLRNGAWRPGPGLLSLKLARPGIAGSSPLGAAVAAVVQPIPSRRRRAIFTIDDHRAIHEVLDDDERSNSAWPAITRPDFEPIHGARAAACSGVLRAWSRGQNGMDSYLQPCIDFMGITAHCDRQDAFVSVGYPPQAESPRYLQCSSRAHPDDVVEQAEHIASGVAEGLKDAAIATVVYSPEIIQGTACINGVVFACAALAADLSARAGAVPPDLGDAVDLAMDATHCVGGDVVSCARLGAAGARAAGITVPGENAGEIALLAERCAREDFAACLRLGEKAAMAAGVPLDQAGTTATLARDCYGGDIDACLALGRRAAKAGIPVGGVDDGAETMRMCGLGSIPDCQRLGQVLAEVPR